MAEPVRELVIQFAMPHSRNAASGDPQSNPGRVRSTRRLARRARAWAALGALLVIAGLATTAGAQASDEVRLEVSSNIQDRYRAGTEHELNVRLALVDPAETVVQGVLFLNVVENDESGSFPQAMHKVFASAETDEDVFRVPLEAARLRSGVEAMVRVRLRDQAPAGTYSIVIQLFEGNVTDPHAVRIDDRVAMTAWTFQVVR